MAPTRREIVIGGMAAGLGATVTTRTAAAEPAPPAPSPPAQTTAIGTVTEPNGTPIADILVSNGRDIVATDAAGRYSLGIAEGQTIFVVKPAGYRMPVDPATNLPRFSYVHDPHGTPASLDFRYGGLAPTGPLPASIDFKLERVEEADAFDVLLFTDPQPESSAEIGYIREDVVAGLIGTQAAFGITSGDIAFDDLAMFDRITRLVGRIGIPWWNVGGNHDLDYEAPDARRSRDTYKRVFGAPHYAHAHGKALFIMLDNVDYLGAGSGKPGEHGAYRGHIAQDQLAFVANLLAKTPRDRLIVLVTHIPLTTYLDPTDPAQTTSNARDLLALVADRPCVSFAGHTHTTEHHYLGAGYGLDETRPHHHHVLTAVSGSWWSGPLDHRGIACADSRDGTPHGYHVLSIDGTRYTTRFVPATEPGARQMRLSLETQFHQDEPQVEATIGMNEILRSPITAVQATGARLVVNVFDGGPRTTVAFAIDDGASISMKPVVRADPFVTQLYSRNPQTIKRWVKAQPSSHIWQAKLPAGLTPGAHAIKVAVVDEYGRDHADGMILEIV